MAESILMWNRLESSLRNENQIDQALRFEIRDALWMLTRQWQFGEFEGEDAGTAAFAHINTEQSGLTGIMTSDGSMQEFSIQNTPFELAIEKEVFLPEVATRLEMGKHWERILTKRLSAASAKSTITQFRSNRKFHFVTGTTEDADRDTKFQNAQQYSDELSLQLLSTLSKGRAIDGYLLYRELKTGKKASVFLAESNDVVNAAGQEFIAWYERTYSQADTKNCWHLQHLEYQPNFAFAPSPGGTSDLTKQEYYGDGIEWFGFLQGGGLASSANDGFSKRTETVIPSGVRFRGMPSLRLWEMEDGQVDFGSIRASSTELSKMIFAEFGLVYGNDWLIAPVQFAAGHMCRVSNIIITDIFGKETVLQEIYPDDNWSFFQTINNEKYWLFMATDNDFIQEGKPIEKVSFLRDEMANIVWGVEEKLKDPFGGGRDAELLAKQTSQFVQTLSRKESVSSEGKPSSSGWQYKAGTLMAENRIPFIPMAADPSQLSAAKRNVVLQRAATPRVANDFVPVRIRPRTDLLGRGVKAETERLDPFFIFEEEVPKAGIALNLLWKRSRWFDGQTYTWLARKKTIGRGEVDANFRFDVLKKGDQ